MSNRVDELETKVKELQAAVNGLTEELVESKERIRQLENAVDVDDPAVRAKSPVQEEPSTADAATESNAETEADASEEPAESADSEQRFVDAEEHEQSLEAGTADEEAKSEQSNDEEDAESENGSDIIVA